MLALAALLFSTYGFSAQHDRNNDEDAAFINSHARRVVAEAKPNTSDIEIVRQVIDIARQRRSDIGESLVNWYAGRLSPGELMRQVIASGYVTNFRFRHDGGDFLLPTSTQRHSSGLALHAMSHLFPNIQSRRLTIPWVIEEDGLMMAGFATGGVPVLNMARVRTFHQHIERGFKQLELQTQAASIAQDTIAEIILANEMTHAYLYNDLRLSIDQDGNSARFIRAGGRDRFVNTRQIHEFISDAASMNTHGVYVFLQWMILPTRLHAADGVVRVRADDPYAYSLQFLVDTLEPILEAKGTPLDLAQTLMDYTDWMHNLRHARDITAWRESWHGFEQWLEADAARIYRDLGDDGLRQLQQAYAEATHELLPIINRLAAL